MAAHSSILGWRVPWTKEPGGPQSAGPNRAGQEQLSTRACPESKEKVQEFVVPCPS